MAPITITADDCSCEVKRGILSGVPFLYTIPPEEMDWLEGLFIDHAYEAGQQIVSGYASPSGQGGSTRRTLRVVGAGLVKLLRLDEEGRETVLDVLVSGDSLGWLEAEETWAIAHTNCCVFEVDSSQLERLFVRYPSVATDPLQSAGSRIEQLHRRLQLLSGASARVRVIAALLQLAEKVGVPAHPSLYASPKAGEAVLLQMPLTRDDLAAFSGTTTETASRVVSALEKEQQVETGRRWIRLLHLEGLQQNLQ